MLSVPKAEEKPPKSYVQPGMRWGSGNDQRGPPLLAEGRRRSAEGTFRKTLPHWQGRRLSLAFPYDGARGNTRQKAGLPGQVEFGPLSSERPFVHNYFRADLQTGSRNKSAHLDTGPKQRAQKAVPRNHAETRRIEES